MVNQIYPPKLQLNKAYASDTEAPSFWIYIYLFLMALFKQKIYDKRDDFDFDTVNFPCLGGDGPRHNFLCLLECAVMRQNLMLEIKV